MQDLYGDWLRQREVEEDGLILVRPDKHIGWRAMSMVSDPETALFDVFSALLHTNTVAEAAVVEKESEAACSEVAYA